MLKNFSQLHKSKHDLVSGGARISLAGGLGSYKGGAIMFI